MRLGILLFMELNAFMPILFKVLFGFVALNIVVNFILLALKKQRMYKLLAVFWPSVLFVFILQAIFQTGDLRVALAYSSTVVPMTIFSMIGFEAIGRKFPLRPYLLLYALAYPLTFLLSHLGFGFETVAMPFAVATGAPLVHTWIYLLVLDRHKTTKLQKLLGAVVFVMPFHCINFALFRMDPGAQLWGWLVAYALYDTIAILLPSIALEEASLHEKDRLEKLVEEKTHKLSRSMKENEGLLKVLLHDVANPLMAIKFYQRKLSQNNDADEPNIVRMNKSLQMIDEIILQVKERYQVKRNSGELTLKPVQLSECFDELSFLFSQHLEDKNVALRFNNQLQGETRVLADKASLTHSVLSNLVSNGLKYSAPNSEIEITARESKENSVILEVKDQGPGIPENIIDVIMSDGSVESTEGTLGEKGTGFGLSIVKSYVDSFGGEIEFDSRYFMLHPHDHGTKVRITLDRAP